MDQSFDSGRRCPRWVKVRHRGLSVLSPLLPQHRTLASPTVMSQLCRLCCKSRKLQGSKFFAKTQSGRQSLIRITSFALAKSPMSLTQGDEVPHVLTRKSRLQPAEFLITSVKRLLQHNLPKPDSCTAVNYLHRLECVTHPAQNPVNGFGSAPARARAIRTVRNQAPVATNARVAHVIGRRAPCASAMIRARLTTTCHGSITFTRRRQGSMSAKSGRIPGSR